MRTNTRTIVGLFGGFALLSATFMSLSTMAIAAPGEGGNGSITVHKYEQPDENLGPNDGSELEPGQVKPVAGVGFTVCEIQGIDLGNAGDWTRLKNLVAASDGTVTEGGVELGKTNCRSGNTSDQGEVEFSSLAGDKAYVVYESTPPKNAVHVAAASILTVPFPGNGTGQAWNYNPHIYPKNVLAGSGASKNGEIIGGAVTFDINVPINSLGEEVYEEFVITDQLSGALTYAGATVTLTAADGTTKVTLTEETDYTLMHTGGLVTLTFLDPNGLAKLDHNIGGKLVLTISANATDSGDTSNTAKITINGGTGEVAVVDPESFFTGAHIKKTAQNKGVVGTVPLAGAGFEIYANDNLDPCPATVGEAASDDGFAKVDTGNEPFVSGVSGNTPQIVLAEGTYCVYETVVPAGYKGSTAGTELEVSGEGASVTIANTQIGSDPGDLPNLPMTGGQARVLMTIIGALLLAAGLVFLGARRRNESQ